MRLPARLVAPVLVVGALAALPTPRARAQVFGADWMLSLERLVSGVKVATRQASATTEQAGTTTSKASEANATGINSSDTALRIANAKQNYGYDTGTGYSACGVSLSIADARNADRSSTAVRQAFTQADRIWLQQGGNGAERIGASLDLRRTFYCTTAEQQRTGWCSTGGSRAYGYGAGDSDASVFLLNRSYGSEEAMTAADYLDTMAPLPTVKAKAATAEEDARRIEALRQGAMLTASRASMMGVIKGGLGGDRPPAGGS